jgi:hypothetical protein
MTLYGKDLAQFNAVISQIGPTADRLMQQNDALGSTVATAAGYAAQLGAWVANGDADAGHLTSLQASVAASVNPGKVAYLIAALNQIGGIDPPLALTTVSDGVYTAVTPTPL